MIMKKLACAVTERWMCHNKQPPAPTRHLTLYNSVLPLAHLMAVLCCRMFHQQHRVAGGRDPAFGGAERGFVCFSLHACSLFVACLVRQLSAVSLAIIECDSSAAMF